MEERIMSSESQANEEENDVKKKQEHIKDRLKEMGVSPDSVRPEKSWLSKYANYFIALIVVALAAVYWYENQKQGVADEAVAVSEENDASSERVLNPYYANQQYNRVPAAGYNPYAWRRQEPENQNNENNQAGVNQMQNNEVNYPRYNTNYQPQYPAYSQPYGPGYSGFYQPRPQIAPRNTYRNTRQVNTGAYRQPPAYNYPVPNPGQMYYYNGWQR
jgi:hypothetical protein